MGQCEHTLNVAKCTEFSWDYQLDTGEKNKTGEAGELKTAGVTQFEVCLKDKVEMVEMC